MNKKLLFPFLLAACILFCGTSYAQLAMTRSTFTGAYSPIALPGATLSTASGDDVAQSAVPIGFTFNYLGTNYTSIGLSTNGVASFDAVMSASATNNNLYVTNNPQNSLAPWWDDLWSDTVLYQLQGISPNQTFTIQWTNSYSYHNTSTQFINFQVILYETTNVIEFSYGNFTPAIAAANESASIGIEGATGGPGNYLDAVTGSAFTSNGMLNATTQWPSHNFRFTPGAPSVLAGGTYTVGLTGMYFNLSEAIADVNHRGISGPVVLSLTDAVYDVTPANGDNFFPMLIGPVSGSSAANTLTIMPASGTSAIISEGTTNGNCGNAAANNIITNNNEPVMGLAGANYVSLQNMNLSCSATGVVDRGLLVFNSSATAGSRNNTFTNISISLNRNNTNTIGIDQRALTTPTSAAGANSNNSYTDLTVSNTYTGIYLNGNANFPDNACVVGTSSATQFNTIGGANPNDIGNGNNASYGIRANNQSSVSIFNNEVRNVSQSGVSSAEGIVIDAGQGNNFVYNNKVHDINYTGTNNTGNITGIRVNLATTGTHTADIYNNFVWNLGSGWNGAPVTTRALRGIYVMGNGGGASTETINVNFNSVRIDHSSAPNISSTCFEIGSVTGPVINARNNVFANFTAAQAGIAGHFCIGSTGTTTTGNAGSASNYNDLYINNSANGYTGIGGTTTYATLANWQVAMLEDANTVAADPGFITTTDLHASAATINNAGTGIPLVTVDIDGQPRAVTPDIGADEFTPLLLDAAITSLVAPVNNGCHSAAEQVTVTLKNFASVPLDFSVDPVTVTVNITGSLTQTLTLVINDNSLNGNVPLPSGSTLTVPVGTINMSVAGAYTFNSYSTLSGDGNALNDAMPAVTLNYSAGTTAAWPANVCAGSSTTVTLAGATAGGTIQWQSSTDGGITWTNETGPGATTASYNVIPAANTMYQVIFCGTITTNAVAVNYYPLISPVVSDDTVCGPGQVNLSASGSGTIYWYTASTGGNAVATGPAYTANVVATTTFYVSNSSGTTTSAVGLSDNSAGGAMSASVNNLIFDVLQNSTLNGVYVYPAAAGNVIVELRDNTNALINTATVAVTAANINQRTFIPLGFALTPGTGFNLVRNAASVNLWRNNIGVTYPYTLPGIISITNSTAGNGFYYFFYDWQIDYGCESPRSPLTVVVNTPPAITLTAGATALCGGDSVMLSITSVNTNYTYAWTPSSSLSAATGSNVMATPPSTTTYTVNADDAVSGCRATDSVMITVSIVPAFTITAADTLVCSGQADTLIVTYPSQSVGLFDNSAGGNMSASVNNLIFDVLANCVLDGVYIYPATAGIVTIELQDNTNAVINTANFTVTAAQVNQRTYVPLHFQLTPATGMQLVRNVASVNLWRNNIGVNYPYTLPGYLSINTSTAGSGFYYYFYDWQVSTPSTNYVFSWSSLPVGYTGTGDTAFVAPAVSTQYIVDVTDTVSGCTSQFSSVVNLSGPVVAMITGASSVCTGDSVLLIASATGGDGNVSYLWSNSLGTNDSVWAAPSVTTTYSVTATDGCGSTSTASQAVTVNAGPPTGTFTYSATGVMTFTFADGTTNAATYAWDFGDAATATTANPVHTYASQGTYTVTLIVSNGCGADTITQVITVTGMENADLNSQLNVYPNPASGSFTVTSEGILSGRVTFELFDLAGNLLLSHELSKEEREHGYRVDVHSYAPGMYMLRLNTDKGKAVRKLIVE